MRITVECYGVSQRWCGTEFISLDLIDSATVADVLDQLSERFSEVAARRETIAVAIGDGIVTSSHLLIEGERMALIPPVSGG